jgi:Domain of unknown function (DUF4924)
MLIARQKLNENIAEYIVYMYQIEDLIRACNLDVDLIIENVVRPQLPDDSFLGQYREWYTGLIQQMKNQRIEKQGHMHELLEILVELSYLHNTLLNMSDDIKYKGLFERAAPFIEEFRERSNLKDKNHIEIAFHAMYMKLLLRLRGQEISAESEEAFDAMRILLAFLAKSYHRMKSGDLNFFNN